MHLQHMPPCVRTPHTRTVDHPTLSRGGIRILQAVAPFTKAEIDVAFSPTSPVLVVACRNVRRFGLTAAFSALAPSVTSIQVGGRY